MLTVRMTDGDFHVTPIGGQELIGGESKAVQDLADVLLHPYDKSRAYGNKAFNKNGSFKVTVASSLMGRSALSSYIRNATTSLIKIQRSAVDMPPEERIVSISELIVKSGLSYADYSFFIAIKLANATPIEQAFRLSMSHMIPDSAGGYNGSQN